MIYLNIWHKYGCCIYPYALVEKGFYIVHPVGIVIGKCTIGSNFTIYQNCTVGTKNIGDESKGLSPVIGDNVMLCTGGCIFGNIHVCDDVIAGANAIVLHDLTKAGTYVGAPARLVKEKQEEEKRHDK